MHGSTPSNHSRVSGSNRICRCTYIILLSVSFWYGKVITTGWLEKISFNSTFWICERGIFLNGLVWTGRVMSRLHGPCSELGRGGWNLQNPPPETTQPVEPTNRRGTEVLLTLWAHILGEGGGGTSREREGEKREWESETLQLKTRLGSVNLCRVNIDTKRL